MKKDCFAYKVGSTECAALKVRNCEGCKFYKTRLQYKKDLEQLSNKGKYYSPLH